MLFTGHLRASSGWTHGQSTHIRSRNAGAECVAVKAATSTLLLLLLLPLQLQRALLRDTRSRATCSRAGCRSACWLVVGDPQPPADAMACRMVAFECGQRHGRHTDPLGLQPCGMSFCACDRVTLITEAI